MNIYLVISDSYKLIDSEVGQILGDSLNVVKYDLRVDNIIDVINEAGYYSLTGEHKFIVVKSGDLFKTSKKEEGEETESKSSHLKILEKYLENPSEDTTIIFTTNDSPDKRKKIYKQIAQKGIVVEIPTFNKKDLCYKCMELLKEKKYHANYDVANYIVENSYINYDIMTSELEKIYTLLKPCDLTIEGISKIISKSCIASAFNYINAVINRNLEAAFKSSENFEVLKIEPNMVLIMLFKEFEIMYFLKSGVKPFEIQKTYRKEEWQMKNYLSNLSLYTLSELKKIIILLNDYDYKLKSGLIDKTLVLDLLAFDLCS